MINARTLAYQILLHMEQKASHPDRLIRSMLARHSRLEDRDRALLTELVYGVLRWQLRLDWHIDQLSKTKPQKVAPGIRVLLRLALYQIYFLDRIPPHAAVNESVKIAKATHPPHLVGFVNGLLREALRRQGDWVWPSPEQDPAQALAVQTSHPQWMVRKFLQDLGFEETRRFFQANNTVAPMSLRVNPLKATPDQVRSRLMENGIEAAPSLYLHDALRIVGLRQDVARLPLHEDGWIQVQDEASQMVSVILSPQPGERVLDLCAGFGGKSTHMAALMQNKGEILSVDSSAWKLEELRANAERQGLGIIETQTADVMELSPAETGSFHRVLLDAPCTGMGSLRRNPDIKWHRHPKDPYRFGQIQRALLGRAAQFVRKGGVLVYATCTLFADEDEEVAGAFSESLPDWKCEAAVDGLPDSCRSMADGLFFKSWPHRHDLDGFFIARWRRPE